MIYVKRLRSGEVALNIDLIEKITQGVDATMITLINKSTYIVEDSLDEVLGKIRLERQQIQAGALKILEEMLKEAQFKEDGSVE